MIADLLLDLGPQCRDRTADRLAQSAQLGQLRGKFSGDVALLEQMALNLAAGGLRNALHRDDFTNFQSRTLIDKTRNLRLQSARNPADSRGASQR